MTVNLHDNYTLFQVKTFEMLITTGIVYISVMISTTAESSPLLEMKKSLFYMLWINEESVMMENYFLMEDWFTFLSK